MKTVYHEAMHPLGNLGLKISMAALESPHIPMHWHDAMEILFCLNGEVTIQIDHEAFLLSRNQLVVFDSKEMHSIQSASPLYMFLCIHVDKKQMALYCPDLELYHIQCQPLPLDHPKSTEYLTLCQLARDLTRSSIKKESTSTMRSDGIALLMLSDLIQSFSVYAPLGAATDEKKPMSTMSGTPLVWAMAANFSMSSTAMLGLAMVSPNMALVLGLKAAWISSAWASGSTKVTSMPSFFRVTANRFRVPP